MTQSYQDWLNEDASALAQEVETSICLAEMHEESAPDEAIDGCLCERCEYILL
jgi:hypothetical protein